MASKKGQAKVYKREDYSYSQLKNLHYEQQMDIATNMLNSCSKQEFVFFKTYKAKRGMITFNGEHLVYDNDYAKQVFDIDEIFKCYNAITKYIHNLTPQTFNEENNVINPVNARKIQTASRIKVLCETYLKNVYLKQADTDSFDELAHEFVKFIGENINMKSKKIPIFNVVKTKIFDVCEINEKLQKQCNYFMTEFINRIVNLNSEQ